MVLIKKKKEKSKEELALQEETQTLKKAGLQDEFQAKGFQIIAFLQKHQTPFFIFAFVIVCTGISILGWTLLSNSANEKASAQYQEALQLLEDRGPEGDTAKKEAAKTAFLKIAKDFERSSVASLATLYAAHLSFELGEKENAVQLYQSFLDKTSKKDKLRPLALAGLGHTYEANNNPDMALKTFEEIIALTVDVNKETALWEAARLAKEKGLTSKAKENAELLLKQYPSSPLASQAQLLIASLISTQAKPNE